MLFGKNDGWHFVPVAEDYHYFFDKHAICGAFNDVPPGAHQDNVPSKHCKDCEITLKQLTQHPEVVPHFNKNKKKMSMRDLFIYLEKMGGLKKTKGLTENVKSGEGVLAILSSPGKAKVIVHT